jgi:hypothetical protein
MAGLGVLLLKKRSKKQEGIPKYPDVKSGRKRIGTVIL